MNTDILRKIPSVYQENTYNGVSEQYTHISTMEVLKALDKEGWLITGGSQQRVRRKTREGFQKHMIMLRHKDNFLGKSDEVPEIVLINSHDGSTAYNLLGGLFRFICANGMIVPNNLMQEQHIIHKGDIINNVIEGVYTVIEELPKMLENIDLQKSVVLDEDDRWWFADQALRLRWEDPKITPEEILKPQRNEDLEPTLWNTFNILQENIVYGGIKHFNSRRTRPLNSIDNIVSVNKGLWELSNVLLNA